jgi:hypothetical protein
MTIDFDTSEYRLSHGNPRGYGSWAFTFPDDDHKEPWWVTPSCTYTEAKKAARAEAKRRFPATNCYVCIRVCT